MTSSIGTGTSSTSLTQTTSGAGLQTIGGLGTGLDTQSIIAALVAAERALENPIKVRGDLADIALQAYGVIRTDLTSLKAASTALSHPADWHTLTATSSNEDAVSVTAGSGTFGGTISFTVDTLAAAGSVRSANTMTGTSTSVTSAASIFVAAGGGKLGFATFESDSNLSNGTHKITVTQASSAATKLSDTALDALTLVDGTNDTLDIEINGTPTSLTLAHGTYTRAQLAAALQDAADSAGAPISVTLTNSNELQIDTTREGSAATLQVTGGNALTALMLSTDGSDLTGTDGTLNVDGGVDQTFSQLDAGSSITLNAAAGTISGVLSGGLRTGSVTGNNITTGDGSLATVVGNINGAGAGVTATAVQVGANTYRLQITSNTAGALNGENLASSAFNANVGGFVTLTTATDAELTVGEGVGAYTITSTTNSVAGLLPGVTVTLKAETTSAVTIGVARDTGAIADKVQALVDAANKAHDTISSLTKYDPSTKQASPLTGDSASERVMNQLQRAFIDAVPWANPVSPGLAGVSIDGSGKFTFDKSKFNKAFAADPEGVTKLFTQGGTAEDSSVSFVSAGNFAVKGDYNVTITQVALQGTDTGLGGAWPPGVLPTVKVRVGSTEVSYAVGGADSRADVADGLNAAFASEGLSLQATDTGSGVKITTNDYGHIATFDVDWDDGNGYVSHAGQDVAGTIGGITATGSGQQLLVPFADKTIGGLALKVTATSIGDLGDFSYQPGVAQRVTTAIASATDLVSGYITSSENGLKSRIKFIKDSIASMELRVTKFEAHLRAQFTQLEATMGMLRSQSNWLSSQVSTLNANNGNGK